MYKKGVWKNFRGSRKLLQAPEKSVRWKKETKKEKKRLPRKKFCGDRLYRKNGWIDFYELRDIDSSNNEGTNCLVNGRIGRERMVRHA